MDREAAARRKEEETAGRENRQRPSRRAWSGASDMPVGKVR